MYYNEEQTVSFISIINLTISDLHEEEYKKLLLSCRESLIPCKVNRGPIEHLMGVNRIMCKNRFFEQKFNVISPDKITNWRGLKITERDACPTESEAQIKEVEKIDGIFIIKF